VLGLQRVEGLSLSTLFGNVLTAHTPYEVEQMFLVGTHATPANPTDQQGFVDSSGVRWPKPWLFARILGVGVLLYAAFRIAFSMFDNPNLIPGMQIIGAFSVPLAVVVFYFEMNAPRNVPLYLVVKYVIYGGVVSIAVSLIGFSTVGKGLTWASASAAGPIEEAGKAVALLLMVRSMRYQSTLNGLLFGGAVGAGFAGFETAGYALRYLVGGGGVDGMLEVLTLRAALAPGGHVAWTAIVGAALWRVKGTQPFQVTMLKDRRFVSAIGFTTAVHAVWNSPLTGKMGTYTVPLLLTVLTWTVLFMYVQHGLREWRDAQVAAAAAPLSGPAQ
jgi:protease PrsW